MAQAKLVHVYDVLKGDLTGKSVQLRGWVHRQRSSGGIVFVVLRDATGVLQCTVKKGVAPDTAFAAADGIRLEGSFTITGTVHADPRAPGGFELRASDFATTGPSPDIPLYEGQGIEHELDNRHLWLRSRKLVNVAKVRATALQAFREWFALHDYWEVSPSCITKSAAEGGSTLFKFDYFGEPAYLTQSSQFYLEAMIFGLERTWCLAPSFRAEKSRTVKHLTEFWHLEGETAWCDNEGNMDVQEALVSYVCNRVAELRPDELTALGRDPAELARVKAPFPRVHSDEAIEVLQKLGQEISWGDDFGAPHERALSDHYGSFLFVKNFPAKIKAFYMALDADGTHAKCADLIAPEGYGELIGGSERSTDLDLMLSRLKEEGANPDNYAWYLDLRRYGSVPHAGFGLGVDRFVAYLCKLEHIRDAIPFPRTPSRAYP